MPITITFYWIHISVYYVWRWAFSWVNYFQAWDSCWSFEGWGYHQFSYSSYDKPTPKFIGEGKLFVTLNFQLWKDHQRVYVVIKEGCTFCLGWPRSMLVWCSQGFLDIYYILLTILRVSSFTLFPLIPPLVWC